MEKANIKKWDESRDLFYNSYPGDFNFSRLTLVKRIGKFYFDGEGGANSIFSKAISNNPGWRSGSSICLRVDGYVQRAKLAIYAAYKGAIEYDGYLDLDALDIISATYDGYGRRDAYMIDRLMNQYKDKIDGWTLDDFLAKGFDVFKD